MSFLTQEKIRVLVRVLFRENALLLLPLLPLALTLLLRSRHFSSRRSCLVNMEGRQHSSFKRFRIFGSSVASRSSSSPPSPALFHSLNRYKSLNNFKQNTSTSLYRPAYFSLLSHNMRMCRSTLGILLGIIAFG